ncbi:single insulin-like growth factor-binding domain protein-2 [Panulirus ornatus]|uniref:single insulin-like growth factor-binding domain protein-2 n=1 Tax=Panulirus ornatus TaxID=150431 RepID=UPI003A88BA88
MSRMCVLFLLLLTHRSLGLSCACVAEECQLPSQCLYGVEMDACRCCTVCMKGPGDVCGGLFTIDGNCGRGLYCYKEASVSHPIYDHLSGVCRSSSSSRTTLTPSRLVTL